MTARAVEESVQVGRFGPTIRLRIDLHGISRFGPGRHHAVIRWEWITKVAPHPHGVVVTSATEEIVLPDGMFGLEAADLAERLLQADSIFLRPEVLDELSRTAGPKGE